MVWALLAGFVCLGISAQNEDGMRWEPDFRLSWSDFRGTPPHSKRVAATTASGISYNYRSSPASGGYVLDFNVDTFFYPEKSWYHKDICDSVVLSHEQLHFDISELFARKMRRSLSGRVFRDNVRSEVRRIFAEINSQLRDFQNRYDRETDFSRNHEAQMAWNRAVARMLREGRYP